MSTIGANQLTSVPWAMNPGEDNQETFTFDADPGTITATCNGVTATVTGSGTTRTIKWLAADCDADAGGIIGHRWHLIRNGVKRGEGLCSVRQPTQNPGVDGATFSLATEGDTITFTLVGGGGSTAWTALLPASLDGVAGWIDPLDLVGSSNPAYIPRGLSVRLLADGRVQLEGLALYVDSSGSPDVPPAASTIATLASGFHPLTRPPFVTAFETSFGDGSLSQASASVSLTGEVKAPQSPTSPLLAITSTYDPA